MFRSRQCILLTVQYIVGVSQWKLSNRGLSIDGMFLSKCFKYMFISKYIFRPKLNDFFNEWYRL